jgi:hypothetical protein
MTNLPQPRLPHSLDLNLGLSEWEARVLSVQKRKLFNASVNIRDNKFSISLNVKEVKLSLCLTN